MTVVQHIPGFVDTDEPPKRATVNSIEELLADPWIGSYAEEYYQPFLDGTRARKEHKFHQFSQTDDGTSPNLIAESDGGNHWWVVGYMSERVDWLPIWKITTAGQARVDKWNRGEVS